MADKKIGRLAGLKFLCHKIRISNKIEIKCGKDILSLLRVPEMYQRHMCKSNIMNFPSKTLLLEWILLKNKYINMSMKNKKNQTRSVAECQVEVYVTCSSEVCRTGKSDGCAGVRNLTEQPE